MQQHEDLGDGSTEVVRHIATPRSERFQLVGYILKGHTNFISI